MSEIMRNRFNTTLGFYEPSVFHLYTRGKGKLSDIKNWETQQASTFLHEYIHFLQDITTAKGLQNMYIIGEYLRYVTQEVKKNNYKVKLPIDPYAASDNVGNNWTVSGLTFGEVDYKATKYVSFTRDLSNSITDDITGSVINIGRIITECLDSVGNRVQTAFGTIQIMEGMAKMVQDTVYPPKRRTSPYNPYYIAIDVANDIIPGLGNNNLTMIAIFDYVLQSSNPGWAFVNYIEEKKNEGFTATSLTYQVVYDDFKNAELQSNNAGVIQQKDAHEQLVKMARAVFKEYLGDVWFFKNIQSWYGTELEKGKQARLLYPQMFIHLAIDGDIRKDDGLFSKLLSIFGTPIVTNTQHDFEFLKPASVMVSKDELMNVYAMMQVHQVFYSEGQFTCPLRKYCQNQPCSIRKQIVDVRCVKAPWERMRGYNRCLFNIWWKFKGFEKVAFV